MQQKAFSSYSHLDSKPDPKQTTRNTLKNLWDRAWLCIPCWWWNFSFLFLSSKFQQWVTLHRLKDLWIFQLPVSQSALFCMLWSETTLPRSLLASSLKRTSSSKVLCSAEIHRKPNFNATNAPVTSDNSGSENQFHAGALDVCSKCMHKCTTEVTYICRNAYLMGHQTEASPEV